MCIGVYDEKYMWTDSSATKPYVEQINRSRTKTQAYYLFLLYLSVEIAPRLRIIGSSPSHPTQENLFEKVKVKK